MFKKVISIILILMLLSESVFANDCFFVDRLNGTLQSVAGEGSTNFIKYEFELEHARTLDENIFFHARRNWIDFLQKLRGEKRYSMPAMKENERLRRRIRFLLRRLRSFVLDRKNFEARIEKNKDLLVPRNKKKWISFNSDVSLIDRFNVKILKLVLNVFGLRDKFKVWYVRRINNCSKKQRLILRFIGIVFCVLSPSLAKAHTFIMGSNADVAAKVLAWNKDNPSESTLWGIAENILEAKGVAFDNNDVLNAVQIILNDNPEIKDPDVLGVDQLIKIPDVLMGDESQRVLNSFFPGMKNFVDEVVVKVKNKKEILINTEESSAPICLSDAPDDKALPVSGNIKPILDLSLDNESSRVDDFAVVGAGGDYFLDMIEKYCALGFYRELLLSPNGIIVSSVFVGFCGVFFLFNLIKSFINEKKARLLESRDKRIDDMFKNALSCLRDIEIDLPHGYGSVKLNSVVYGVNIKAVMGESLDSDSAILSVDAEKAEICVASQFFLRLSSCKLQAALLLKPVCEIAIKQKFEKLKIQPFPSVGSEIEPILNFKERAFAGLSLIKRKNKLQMKLRGISEKLKGVLLLEKAKKILRDLVTFEFWIELLKDLRDILTIKALVKMIVKYGVSFGAWFWVTELFSHIVLPGIYAVMTGHYERAAAFALAPAEGLHGFLVALYFFPIIRIPIILVVNVTLSVVFFIVNFWLRISGKYYRAKGFQSVGLSSAFRNDDGVYISPLALFVYASQNDFGQPVQLYLNSDLNKKSSSEIARIAKRYRFELLLHRKKELDELGDSKEEWQIIKKILKYQKYKQLIVHYKSGETEDAVVRYLKELNDKGITPVIENPLCLRDGVKIDDLMEDFISLLNKASSDGVNFKIALNISKLYQEQHKLSNERALEYLNIIFSFALQNKKKIILQLTDNKTRFFSFIKNSCPIGDGVIPYKQDVFPLIMKYAKEGVVDSTIVEFAKREDAKKSMVIWKDWIANYSEGNNQVEANVVINKDEIENQIPFCGVPVVLSDGVVCQESDWAVLKRLIFQLKLVYPEMFFAFLRKKGQIVLKKHEELNNVKDGFIKISLERLRGDFNELLNQVSLKALWYESDSAGEVLENCVELLNAQIPNLSFSDEKLQQFLNAVYWGWIKLLLDRVDRYEKNKDVESALDRHLLELLDEMVEFYNGTELEDIACFFASLSKKNKTVCDVFFVIFDDVFQKLSYSRMEDIVLEKVSQSLNKFVSKFDGFDKLFKRVNYELDYIKKNKQIDIFIENDFAESYEFVLLKNFVEANCVKQGYRIRYKFDYMEKDIADLILGFQSQSNANRDNVIVFERGNADNFAKQLLLFGSIFDLLVLVSVALREKVDFSLQDSLVVSEFSQSLSELWTLVSAEFVGDVSADFQNDELFVVAA